MSAFQERVSQDLVFWPAALNRNKDFLRCAQQRAAALCARHTLARSGRELKDRQRMIQRAVPWFSTLIFSVPSQRGSPKESTGQSSDQGARACAQAGSKKNCSGASSKGPCLGPQGSKTGGQGCRSRAQACRQACRVSCKGAGIMQPWQMLRLGSSFSLPRADSLVLVSICSTQALATGG